MNYVHSRHWKTAALGTVVKPSNEKISPSQCPGTRYLGLEHIEAGTQRIISIGTAQDVVSAKTVFHAGDVLYGRLRPYLRKIVVAPFDGICSTDFLVFKPTATCASRFLKYFLSLPYVTEFATRHSTGVQLPRIGFDKLASLELPLPSIQEQRRIVEGLDSLAAQIEPVRQHLSRAQLILAQFRRAVLAAACSGRLTEEWRNSESILGGYASGPGLPTSWRRVPLHSLVHSLDYGTSTKSQKAGTLPVLRMGNIQNGSIDWARLAYTSDAREINRYSLRSGTVLFNRTNSPELVGKSAIYRGERPAIFAGYLIRINARPEIDPEYLNICLNAPIGREFCRRVRTDGVSQSNINARTLGTFAIPLCSLGEQREIVRRVAQMMALAQRTADGIGQAEQVTSKMMPTILSRAFSGELAASVVS